MHHVSRLFCVAFLLMLASCLPAPTTAPAQQNAAYQSVSPVYLRTPIPPIMGRENEFYQKLRQYLPQIDRSLANDTYLFLYASQDGTGIRARLIFKSSRSDREMQNTAKAVAKGMLQVARDMGMATPARSLNLSCKVLHSQESKIWMAAVRGNTDITVQETEQIN